jgi:endonuclease/exonuclease/phosphatase family metal-dependent hydrolase
LSIIVLAESITPTFTGVVSGHFGVCGFAGSFIGCRLQTGVKSMEYLKTIGISVVILLMLAGCAVNNRIASPSIQFPPQQDDSVRIMTFNIRTGDAWWLDGWNCWGNRRKMVIDTLAENAADIIGLQEGVDYQLEEIQQAMPQYSKYSAGRTNGKKRGETCAIFYRTDRFELIDKGTFWFSKNPSAPGSRSWGNLFPRLCSWVHLVDKTNQMSFYLYNVHLDVWSQKSREKSVRLLAERIADRKTQDPFIVVGDFNMELDNPAMVYLQETANPRMTDAWQSVHGIDSNSGTYHEFSGKVACPRIDHIPIGENAVALDATIDRYEVGGRYPSDHFPVIATIRINARQPIAMGMQ